MNTAAAKPQTETTVRAVAHAEAAARSWGARLHSVGVSCSAGQDLDEALQGDPALLVIDPSGWEESCRHTLEEFAGRPDPPPAVVFVAAEPEVQLTAGPAYAYLSPSCSTRDLSATVSRALRAREAFAVYWPSALRAVPVGSEARIKSLLRRRTGIDIRADRQSAFAQAVRTRMVACLTPKPGDYADLLERSRGEYSEVELLSQLLVIGETYFWRYAGQFRALQNTLVPLLIREAPRGQRCFRAWSAGCSSGEEAYSLAIAGLKVLPPSWQIEVHATDIDRTALTRARCGVYGRRSLRNLPPELRRGALDVSGDEARVSDRVRDVVQFHHLNLASPAADQWVADHGPFHAIFCRNVLIYFSRPNLERVVERFERTLVMGGGLFLGAAETLHPSRPGMVTVRDSGSFFFRRVAPEDPPLELPPQRTTPDLVVDRVGELYAVGLSRLDAEDFDGADEAFGEIEQLQPEDARSHTGRALLLANQGREGEAAEHLQRASGCSPDLPETRYLQGLMAERAGQDGDALQHYEAALVRDPGFFMAHVNRAWILRRLGRRARFRAEMRVAFAILNSKPPVARWLTGGLGWEALVEMVRGALHEPGGEQ